MTNGKSLPGMFRSASSRRRSGSGLAVAAAGLALLVGGCVFPEKVGREFRAQLASMPGLPVQTLVDEIGPTEPALEGSVKRYEWNVITVGPPYGDCRIEAVADDRGVIVSTALEGRDYPCGHIVRGLRRQADQYRADPSLWERQRAAAERHLREIVRLRRELGQAQPKQE